MTVPAGGASPSVWEKAVWRDADATWRATASVTRTIWMLPLPTSSSEAPRTLFVLGPLAPKAAQALNIRISRDAAQAR
ncbi:MAG TPA: hypothetical protein VFR92_09695 [Sphingomicrobium sp.]|nr:hypothetical protein [Sphingomicrobium sp.]